MMLALAACTSKWEIAQTQEDKFRSPRRLGGAKRDTTGQGRSARETRHEGGGGGGGG